MNLIKKYVTTALILAAPMLASGSSLKGLPTLSGIQLPSVEVGQGVYSEEFGSWSLKDETYKESPEFLKANQSIKEKCDSMMREELGSLNKDLEEKGLVAIPYGSACSRSITLSQASGAIHMAAQLNQKVIIVKK